MEEKILLPWGGCRFLVFRVTTEPAADFSSWLTFGGGEQVVPSRGAQGTTVGFSLSTVCALELPSQTMRFHHKPPFLLSPLAAQALKAIIGIKKKRKGLEFSLCSPG